MINKNQDVRTHAKKKGIPMWAVAEQLGISEPSITRMLRHELPEENKRELIMLIDEIAAQEG